MLDVWILAAVAIATIAISYHVGFTMGRGEASRIHWPGEE